MTSESSASGNVDRRTFLATASVGAGVMFIKPQLVFGTEANSAVRVGLLGCGGRGSEDASNLVDAGARVVALADLFQDQLDAARNHFDQLQQPKGYSALDSSHLFVGPRAYEQISSSKEVDAIVIATPPYYHPQHLEAVVAAGKHVYLEKPVAVDVPGALKVVEIGKRAHGKLSLDVGFQIRDCPPFVELVNRIHNGALGTIVCGEAHYLTGYLERAPRANASPVELRLRNWVYDRALSGDIILEQNIHVIDICNWILQSHPLRAAATCGRKGRPAGDGDANGNYNVLFHYPNDVDVTFTNPGNGRARHRTIKLRISPPPESSPPTSSRLTLRKRKPSSPALPAAISIIKRRQEQNRRSPASWRAPQRKRNVKSPGKRS